MDDIGLLPKSFYQRLDVVEIARDLIGKVLHSYINGVHTSGRIVETEAYRAPDDKACHAYNNLRTTRTETMFQEGGRAYIYLCYGIHHLFNVVTGPENIAHAVLIRGLEPLEGISKMMLRRNLKNLQPRLSAGPGSLSKALGLTTDLTGISLIHSESEVFITSGHQIGTQDIIASPRVGIAYAEECAAWPWRFRLKNSKWTSPAK